jgi:hypothetical protein
MARLLDEFDRRNSLLNGLNYNHAGIRISGFLDWLESQPETRQILDDLRNRFPVTNLLKDSGMLNPPNASTPEEVASVGIFFMEKVREGKEIFHICYNHGVTPSYTTSQVQPYLDELMERFIIPTVDYIRTCLEEIAESITAENLISQTFTQLKTASFGKQYPSTSDYLGEIEKQMAKTDEYGTWLNIGNLCRETLKAFASELQSVSGITAPGEVKEADVKGILRYLLKQFKGDGRFEETLEKLLVSVWDHAQSVLHRQTTTKSQASRLFLWTALAIYEFAYFIDERTEHQHDHD